MQSNLSFVDKKEIIDYILNYLEHKGKIKAALLHKIENRIFNKNVKFEISKTQLIDILLDLVKEKKVEMIIPKIINTNWNKATLSKLKFLRSGKYYIRQFYEKKVNRIDINENEDSYLFDSRNMISIEKDFIKKLKDLLKKHPTMKRKIIFFKRKSSDSIFIYEKDFNLFPLKKAGIIKKSTNIPRINKINNFLEYRLKDQKSDLSVIKSYRKNFMCFYIALIESIQYEIIKNQGRRKKSSESKKILKKNIEKFAFYCDQYVKSDWIDTEPNPLRWESFFNILKIPIEIIEFKFNSIYFFDRTFDCDINLKFGISIPQKRSGLIKILRKKGFELLNKRKNKKIIIGLDLNLLIPCPSIEYFYFIVKYFFYFNLFLLFSHCFTYIKEKFKIEHLTDKEKDLYKIFSPVMHSLFVLNDNKINKKFIFKYYTLKADELELLYNKFLLKEVKRIEKKLYRYFLFKFSYLTNKT
ncbi:MAG: hypothetical protein EU518_00085 [Promethearchaeota archaeon]|nr:MAG: hypothetical protein EU518_00085 [Candidatus Lokiarchaeota archaeon]